MFALILTLFYVMSPCVEMREEPKPDSTMASQAYFSESVRILEESGEWVKIETTVDQYKGWVKGHNFCKNTGKFLADPTSVVAQINRLSAHLYDRQDTECGPILTLPFESKLEVIDKKDRESTGRWIKVSLPDGREGYIQRGDVVFAPKLLSQQEMCELSQKFLNLPYTYGGRSSFGYDCSGFMQMLYRQRGIFIPRDSKDQVKWDGFQETTLEKLVPGDLIFFGLGPDAIRHVGMFLGNDTFIHATVAENQPWIHVSHLSDKEWNGSGRYTFRTFRTLKKS